MAAGAATGFPGPDTGGVRRPGNRYELGALLGRGGTAEVHAAHDLRLGRCVAVKTLRSDLAGDPASAARFRREALSAASLNHPSIVAVYDTGEDLVGGVRVPYIVMERVDGSTFADLLDGGRHLPPSRALELTAGVLAALAHAHRSGVVHSDIKPTNVMLSHDGAVKVTDFGTARRVDVRGAPLTPHTAVIGTPKYLSPEQARGEAVGASADLYSTGCLLYELLTARPPFPGDGVIDLIVRHAKATPQPPSSWVPGLPPACDALVLRALRKAPGERHPDAEDMLRDVERVLAGLSPGARDRPGRGDAAAGGRAGAHRSAGPPPPTVHTDPTPVFPASGPPLVVRERRSRPARRRTGRTAALVTGALLAVSAGVYAGTVADLGGTDTGGSGAVARDAPPSAASASRAPEPSAEPPSGRGARGGRETTEVPDLLGRTPARARAAAERAGLRIVRTGRRAYPGRRRQEVPFPVGRVCGQTPEPGTGLARGSGIRVTVRTRRR